jgi:hypothetical protein
MEQDPALSLCRRLLARWTFALARAVEMAVDGGAGDVEEVRDLLDGPIASVVELLREDGLVWVELGSSSAAASRARAAASPWRVFAMISSRWSSARTESIPNIARPSAVVVSRRDGCEASRTLDCRGRGIARVASIVVVRVGWLVGRLPLVAASTWP